MTTTDEALTIKESILRFSDCLPGAHIVVVDNNSSDETTSIARATMSEYGVDGQVIRENQVGKGNAVYAGFSAAKGAVYVMCDSDCTYPIEDVDRIIQPIIGGDADFVIGNRLSSGAYRQQNRRLFHGVGNTLLTVMTNVCFSTQYADVASGFKAFSSQFVDSYKTHAPGFDIEVDLAIHAAINSFPSLDIPISYHSRPEGSFSKLNTYRDGFASIKKIISRFLAHQYSVFRAKS